MEKRNEKRNLIRQQYLSSKTNHVICVDITQIGSYGYAFVALDLAARNIVGHCYKEYPLNVQDILDCLDAIIKQRSFLPNIKIIHSDRESCFKNDQYYDFMQQQNIQVSRGSTEGHDNQVIERTFRTIKDIMRKLLHPNWTKKERDPLTQKGFDIKQIDGALQKTIETYNNKPHKALYLMTPNQMEEALFQHGDNTLSASSHEEEPPGDSRRPEKQIPLLARNDDSPEARDILGFKQEVALNYAGDWVRFFVDFRTENNFNFNKLMAQNRNLYEQNLKLQESLTFVREEVEVMRNSRIKAEDRKLRRQNAQKQMLRDSITPQEFQYIIDSVKAKGFVPARKRTAFILLYCTGLRVSNLLVFSINHIKDLMDKGKTYIPLNKGGDSRHLIALSTQGQKLLHHYFQDFSRLMLDKERTFPFFTTQIQLQKSINRCSFDNELNAVLRRASLELHKHIRTHSFRATIISDLLESTPIQVVRDLIGHRSIKTTVQYNRNKVTEQQLERVLANMDKIRAAQPNENE